MYSERLNCALAHTRNPRRTRGLLGKRVGTECAFLPLVRSAPTGQALARGNPK